MKLIFPVDIGTTTICGELMELEDPGTILAENTVRNSQTLYGKDVMARIKAAQGGKAQELMSLVRGDVLNLLETCLEDSGLEDAGLADVGLEDAGLTDAGLGIKPSDIEIYIAANTVMEHILMGWDVKGLGEYPYTPVSIDYATTEIEGIKTVIMPGLGPFVGADILSGLGYIEYGLKEKNSTYALLDMGTNGEIALYDGNRYYAASTAAGPALEGAGISCGCAALPGAIYKVEIAGRLCHPFRIEAGTEDRELRRGRQVTGLCGSGVISVTSELLRNNIIGRDGTFRQEFADEGFEISPGIYFGQEDVRSLQYAKAAIRAGLEVLCEQAGLDMNNIDRLYLAGNFGKNLDLEEAASIGLIPENLKDRALALGNTSLMGAGLLASGKISLEDLEEIKRNCTLVELGGDLRFQEEYIGRMNFNI